MEQYILNYYLKMGVTPGEFVPCEYCAAEGKTVASVNIHHVIPRSHFGSKRRDERDSFDNLCALCYECHTIAHAGPNIVQFNERLKAIVSKRNSIL